jgi:predicted CXXCH cytochrome family protein
MERKNLRRAIFSLTFLISVSLVFLYASYGTDASAQMRSKESCVTKDCHQDKGKAKYVHGPAATGDCVFCHEKTGKHEFKPITKAGEQCYKCHDRVDMGKAVHSPVKDGKCAGCHDPHQSDFEFQLRGEGAELCFICHKKGTIMKGDFVHGPVAVGGCSICHNPHYSDFPKMLMAEGNEVCYSCHTDKVEAFQDRKFTHAPVQANCLQCHDPHSGKYMFNFAADGKQELCFSCHEDKKTHLDTITVKHGGLYTDKKYSRSTSVCSVTTRNTQKVNTR